MLIHGHHSHKFSCHILYKAIRADRCMLFLVVSFSISFLSQGWWGRFQTASPQRLSLPPSSPIGSATGTAAAIDLGPVTAAGSSPRATVQQALALPGQLLGCSFDEHEMKSFSRAFRSSCASLAFTCDCRVRNAFVIVYTFAHRMEKSGVCVKGFISEYFSVRSFLCKVQLP